MPVPWKTYVSRRKLRIVRWLKNNKIRSYDDLVRVCRAKVIVPPPLDDNIKTYLAAALPDGIELQPVLSPKVSPDPKPKPKPEPKPKPKPKLEPEPELPKEKLVPRPVWNSMMKKSKLLDIANSAGLKGLSEKSTKAQIISEFIKGKFPESPA